MITYGLVPWFTKKIFEKYLLAFNRCFDTESFYGRTCREPPPQNPSQLCENRR